MEIRDMFEKSNAFISFAVQDVNAAMDFYAQVLGLKVTADAMGLYLHIDEQNPIFVYEKTDFTPAAYTILNFPVDSIDTAVDALTEQGIAFEVYNTLPAPQDEKGILRGKAVNQGPDIAWFKDPSGNVLSVLEK
jgi:predicted enzyme related to lactoylglutathione lyase